MNALQLLMLAGMLVAAGVAFVWWLAPGRARPRRCPRTDLAATPAPRSTTDSLPGGAETGWVCGRCTGSRPAGRSPRRDLAVLRKSIASFYGDKFAFVASRRWPCRCCPG